MPQPARSNRSACIHCRRYNLLVILSLLRASLSILAGLTVAVWIGSYWTTGNMAHQSADGGRVEVGYSWGAYYLYLGSANPGAAATWRPSAIAWSVRSSM